MAHKVCPIVFRTCKGVTEVLCFRHPLAGKQFVKGSLKEGEAALAAALRELQEESGIAIAGGLLDLGEAPVGTAAWHFFAVQIAGLPDCWEHQTLDDFGHLFSFFWHPLSDDLDEQWHAQFHEAFQVMRRRLPA